MKARVISLALLALATTLPVSAQYSARQLTRKVVPPPQQSVPAQAPQQGAVPRSVAGTPGSSAASDAKARALQERNEAKQFGFYKSRAEQGSDHAQYELGMRYLAGKGVQANPKLGREWLEKSAKQGNTKAASELKKLGPAAAETNPAPSITPAADSSAAVTGSK